MTSNALTESEHTSAGLARGVLRKLMTAAMSRRFREAYVRQEGIKVGGKTASRGKARKATAKAGTKAAKDSKGTGKAARRPKR